MGSVGLSDWEEGVGGSSCIGKRPKMLKKFSEDCLPVDYGLVPRKLRSVKRRGSGSTSSHLLICKKHNRVANGDALPGKNGRKKVKLTTIAVATNIDVKYHHDEEIALHEQGISVRPGTRGFGSAITKDEEEVAETLFALADMVPETAKDKIKLTGEPSKSESDAFCIMETSDSGAEVVLEKRTETRTISRAGTETNRQSSNVGGSTEGAKIPSLTDGSCFDSLVKNSSTELPQQSNIEMCKNFGKSVAAAAIRGHKELLHSLGENKNDGSSLWPGLMLKKSLHSETHSPLSKSSSSKFSAISRPQRWEDLVIPKKGVQVHVALRKPWKKSCTHIHISNLINELKKPDALQLQSTQPAHFEEQNTGAFITSNTPTENTNNVFPLASNSNAASSATGNNSNEIRNAVLLHKRLLQDQKHTAPASQFFTFQNQNLNFFPLPAGGVGESSHGIAKVDQLVGTGEQLHLPYLHSNNQHTIPFHLHPNYYYSTGPSGRGTAVAQQVQLPSNRGSSNYGQATGVTTALPKQQSRQTQQQQQNWHDQLTEHWKSGQIPPSNIANWQNGVQDGPSLFQFTSFFSQSHSPLAVFSQNYALRQQQKQPSTMPPLLVPPPSREQGQTHLQYGLQGKGGCHPDSVQPALQLLCNQQT